MRYFALFISFSILFCAQTIAQEEYPYRIENGESKIVKANQQDLWVLKENQFNNALSDSKQLDLIKKELGLKQQQYTVLEEQCEDKDSLISILTKDRDYYKNLYDQAHMDIEDLTKETKKNIRRQKIYKKATIFGIPAAFLLGLIIGFF
jgi:hypothetical protein